MPQVWTCVACESQLFFCMENGDVVCCQCRATSNQIRVVRRDAAGT